MAKAYAFWGDARMADGRSHEQWLRDEAENYTLGELCAHLQGRTEGAVRQKLQSMGLRCKMPALPQVISPAAGKESIEGLSVKSFLAAIKDKPKSHKELSQEFDRSEDTIEMIVVGLKAQGYEISETLSEKMIWSTRATSAVAPPPTIWEEEYGQFIMGKISDLQTGSKWAQLTNLRQCVQEMYEAGVRRISIAGDLTAGNNVYRGQIHDIVTPSGPEQVAMVVEYLPRYPGLEYRLIGGNHDFSFTQQNGYNPVLDLANKRTDVFYAGFDMADIPITPLTDERLWHPRGGVPYAASYRLQKGVEQAAFEQLYKALNKKDATRLLMIDAGHLHIALDFWAGPILCMQIGCFEGKTPLLKRMGVTPFIGGVILEFQLTGGGMMRQVSYRQLQFDEIPNDYLNYPVPREDELTVEPMFQWMPEQMGEEEAVTE